MALGSFTGMGFHFANDINSKLNWCIFISRLALKENIKMFKLKMFGFKLTKNSNWFYLTLFFVSKTSYYFTYKEKCFLEFRSLGSGSSYKKESSGHLFLFLVLEN